LLGFGALAGWVVLAWMFRNPRRTRAGVRRPGGRRLLPGAAEVVGQEPGEAELGVAGDDQPGPAVGGLGVRIFGRIQPRVCLNSRNVCSTWQVRC
jgi:hypothetical protein